MSMLAHRVLEQEAILGHLDRRNLRPDQLDVVLLEDAELVELDGQVERGLPAHRREQRIGPLLLDDPLQRVGGERLDVGPIGQLGIGHDGGGIAVHQHHFQALALERLDRLGPRIIELAGLADDNRSGSDHEYTVDVSPLWHPLTPQFAGVAHSIRPNSPRSCRSPPNRRVEGEITQVNCAVSGAPWFR
jgi:hypothetical protein